MPLKLPDGFSIEIFAKDLPGARVMAMGSGGMYVSQTSEGKIAHIGFDVDGNATRPVLAFSSLQKPHGIVVDPADKYHYYIAEEHRIFEFYDAPPGITGPEFNKIVDLPSGGGHFTRTLGFGPDGRLYVSIGSSCNVCNEKDKRRAKIFSMNPDGSDFKGVARGLRNAVFFTWNPVDGSMWATEMGRDLLGDDLPPDEINIIPPPSSRVQRLPPDTVFDYGWPICYGKNVHDSNFDPAPEQARRGAGKNVCEDKEPSYIDLPAHSAPLGLAFIPAASGEPRPDGREEGWPEDYWYDLLVAYHGSWNRSEPTGYKVARVKLDAQGNYEGTEDFITGWLQPDGTALGRPVDILVQPGGMIYVSDDKAGVIYRVRRNVLE